MDEASFRQSTTLHQTWAPVNHRPSFATHGKRNAIKVYGAICPQTCVNNHRLQKHYFTGEDYLEYLEGSLAPTFYRRGRRIFLIQDNASYHKSPEVIAWAEQYQKYIHIESLPPYSPELNASEKLWKFIRKEGTHNRFFQTEDELQAVLEDRFQDLSKNSWKMRNYMRPFI